MSKLTLAWVDETEKAANLDAKQLEFGWMTETILRLIAHVRAQDEALREIEDESHGMWCDTRTPRHGVEQPCNCHVAIARAARMEE